MVELKNKEKWKEVGEKIKNIQTKVETPEEEETEAIPGTGAGEETEREGGTRRQVPTRRVEREGEPTERERRPTRREEEREETREETNWVKNTRGWEEELTEIIRLLTRGEKQRYMIAPLDIKTKILTDLRSNTREDLKDFISFWNRYLSNKELVIDLLIKGMIDTNFLEAKIKEYEKEKETIEESEGGSPSRLNKIMNALKMLRKIKEKNMRGKFYKILSEAQKIYRRYFRGFPMRNINRSDVEGVIYNKAFQKLKKNPTKVIEELREAGKLEEVENNILYSINYLIGRCQNLIKDIRGSNIPEDLQERAGSIQNRVTRLRNLLEEEFETLMSIYVGLVTEDYGDLRGLGYSYFRGNDMGGSDVGYGKRWKRGIKNITNRTRVEEISESGILGGKEEIKYKNPNEEEVNLVRQEIERFLTFFGTFLPREISQLKEQEEGIDIEGLKKEKEGLEEETKTRMIANIENLHNTVLDILEQPSPDQYSRQIGGMLESIRKRGNNRYKYLWDSVEAILGGEEIGVGKELDRQTIFVLGELLFIGKPFWTVAVTLIEMGEGPRGFEEGDFFKHYADACEHAPDDIKNMFGRASNQQISREYYIRTKNNGTIAPRTRNTWDERASELWEIIKNLAGDIEDIG